MHGLDFRHVQYESESVHFVHVQRLIFAWRGPYSKQQLTDTYIYLLMLEKKKTC